MAGAEPRSLLLVTGMHRSGTSALCAALRAAGASFGDHLLEAMAGVNDEGFWEDADVVALNERLLAARDSAWYSLAGKLAGETWSPEEFATEYALAAEILARGFGPGPVEAVKDPRFCLTLGFWLRACADVGVAANVCVASRAPLEVASSLERRDGFPIGYGLRLAYQYLVALQSALPGTTTLICYPDLLRDAASSLAPLAENLPAGALDLARAAEAVRGDLRHQVVEEQGGALHGAPVQLTDLAALKDAVNAEYPAGDLLRDFAGSVVSRGNQLTDIGTAHSEALLTIEAKDRDNAQLAAEYEQALATIAERDEQIAEFDRRLQQTGDELATALATIDERDGQIREFDRRLAEIGAMHSHALEVIADKDRQIDEFKARIDQLCNLPVIGLAFRMAKNHAKR